MTSQSITWFLDIEEPALPPAPVAVPDKENYTSEEISAAVGKLVQGAIRRPYGILGERKTLDAFDDTMDAAAGVFILTPSAPFYVILLGSRRLNDATTGAITSAASLLDAINSAGRQVRPLSNITSLGNARSALLALENASSSRSSAFEDISTAPAFQRFEKHTDRFLADSANGIKVGTEIVQTPQQARKSLGNLVSELTDAFRDIQRRVKLLYEGIDNYNSLNLPSLLATGVIGKTRAVLESRIEQLDQMTPTQRLEVLRDTVLDVLAGKAVVKGFGSLAKSGEFVPIEGFGHLFSDADHPSTRAVVEPDLLDPYIIVDGADSLTFTLDGGPNTVTIPLPQSFLARLDGFTKEPFEIDAGVNDEFEVEVSNAPDVSVVFTAGTRTAAQIVAEFNAEVGASPIVADTYLAPEKFIGPVNAINATGTTVQFVKTGSNWSLLDVVVGDGVIVQDGAMNQIYLLITSRSGLTITCTVSGAGTTVNATGVTISVGPPGRYVRIRIADGQEAASLEVSRTLRVAEGDFPAAPTLGMAVGVELACRRTRADEVALAINTNASSSISGVPRVSAEAVFVGGDPTSGRSEVGNPTMVVSSIYKAIGDVTASGPSPAHFAVAGAASAGVKVGDIITMRTAATLNQVGARGVITLVSDTEVRANMSVAIPSVGTGFSLEFGLNLDPGKDVVIRILAPSQVSGDYRVGINESNNPTEITLDRPLPFSVGVGGQSITFQMQVGAFGVNFYSEDRTVHSQLEVSGTAAERFFTTVPRLRVGETRWVLLDNDPKVLGVGDRLEFYSGQYNEPQDTGTIIGFEHGQRLLELDTPFSNSILEFDFTVAIDSPFARIRKMHRNNYDAFKVQLGLWLALSVNEDRYFSDLNRFLNPLIVNENPTLSAVNTAKNHVQPMVQALQQLQLILLSYEVDGVPQVDTLISSFLSRGSDRAVDTLLEARFTEFFGYNSEEVSYIGNALERLRDVSRLDLPVRRTQRKEVIDQELLLSEFEDPDFEFDQSDTQDTDEPDIPGSFIDIPGGNF